MKKFLGGVFIILLLYVGFCGIEIKTSVGQYKIPPFITNFLQSNAAKQAANEIKNVKDNVSKSLGDTMEK